MSSVAVAVAAPAASMATATQMPPLRPSWMSLSRAPLVPARTETIPIRTTSAQSRPASRACVTTFIPTSGGRRMKPRNTPPPCAHARVCDHGNGKLAHPPSLELQRTSMPKDLFLVDLADQLARVVDAVVVQVLEV